MKADMPDAIKYIFTLISLTLVSACGGGGNGSALNSPIVAADPCAVTSRSYGDVTFPSAYAGAYQVPTPAAKLPANITRTINLQDVDVWWRMPASQPCTNPDSYRINALIEDLNRVKKIGVDRVWVYNYAHFDDFSKTIWTISDSEYILPRPVLETFVKEAHARGIKVFYAFQFAFNCDMKGNCLDTSTLSAENMTRLLESHKRQILSDALYGSQIGLDGIKVDLDSYQPKIYQNYNSNLKNIYIEKTASTIDELRKVFTGTVSYGQSNSIYDSRIISKVDELILSLFLSHNVSPFTVVNWKNEVADYISNFQYWIEQESGISNVTIPIAWELYAESVKEFYTTSWLDNFCTLTLVQQNNCPQQNLNTDFSMQAIVVEGAFQAIAEQVKFTTGSVSTYGYSHNDDMVPTIAGGGGAVVFPNIDNSIRNKPAEQIVKFWYEK